MHADSPPPNPLPLPSDQAADGRTLGKDESELLARAIESGILTSTKGQFVKKLEADFAEMLEVRHVIACSSGSAAIHTAVAAINPEPGDEIVTTPITDMGALTAILYQGAVPVFADVDPLTFNVTADTIEARLSRRTRAIVATHLFGNPCDMAQIKEIGRKHNLPIIEDAAQAFLARFDQHFVGTLGAIGCFSLQQGKHITCGEGGLLTTNDDDLARHMRLFVNKGWPYGEEGPDHEFLAPNYRMTELQGAVAVGQLGKLEPGVRNRIHRARELSNRLAAVNGVDPAPEDRRGENSYWRYCLGIDDTVIPGGSPALGGLLRDRGIVCAPRYVQKPAFECRIFREQRTFGDSRFPFNLARAEAVDYSPERFPGAYRALNRMLVLPWNENYTRAHVTYLADAIEEAANSLSR